MKPSVTVECPNCGQPAVIEYTQIADPDLPPGQIRVRPSTEHTCEHCTTTGCARLPHTDSPHVTVSGIPFYDTEPEATP